MRQTAKSKRDVQRDTESCCMDSHVLLRSGEIREHSVGGWVGGWVGAVILPGISAISETSGNLLFRVANNLVRKTSFGASPGWKNEVK